MVEYRIGIHGDYDDEELHQRALAAACEAIEEVNPASVYRAWVEPVEHEPSASVDG